MKTEMLNLNKRKLTVGVVNITPDSFYDGGKYFHAREAITQAERLLEEGADIIDLGACSSRPNAVNIDEEEELRRLLPVLTKLVSQNPETVISVDTYNSRVAEEAIKAGASVINDISGGTIDPNIFDVAARYDVPYILTHIQGTPATMQLNPYYEDVVNEVKEFFKRQLDKLNKAGVNKVILDPGFGFGKSVEHNFRLLKNLDKLQTFGLPVMVGLSRKSMINKVLKTSPSTALTGTISLNTIALLNGASMLRVHDVKEAAQVIKLVTTYLNT